MSKPPELADPGSSPRFSENAGAVKRDPAIWSREQFGPWVCDVTVTPITGMRRGYPVFEVRCAWQSGPGLLPQHDGAPRVAAADLFYVDRESPDLRLTGAEAEGFAVELAQRAADLLAEAVKPDLALLARAILRRLK